MTSETTKIQHARADAELLEQLGAGSKVLTVCSEIRTTPGQIIPMARQLAQTCRRLEHTGYDLRFCQIKAHLLRDDDPVEVDHELRVDPRTGKLGSYGK